jgi:hypothetical protein
MPEQMVSTSMNLGRQVIQLSLKLRHDSSSSESAVLLFFVKFTPH